MSLTEDFKEKNSAFRNHTLKNVTAIGFSLPLIAPEMIPEGPGDIVNDIWSGEPIEFRKSLTKMDSFVTWARNSSMYVDIKQEKKGHLEISSPLELKPHSIKGAIKEMKESIQTFEHRKRRHARDEIE